jgi:hypothetical protein
LNAIGVVRVGKDGDMSSTSVVAFLGITVGWTAIDPVPFVSPWVMVLVFIMGVSDTVTMAISFVSLLISRV